MMGDPGAPGPVARAALEGETLDLLRAQRMRLAHAFDNPSTPPRDLTPLSRQLLIIGKEIDALTIKKVDQAAAIMEDETWDGSVI